MSPSYQEVLEVVEASGIWTNGSRRQHGFVLSPSVLELTAQQAEDLRALAPALYDCMSGIGRMVATSAQPKLVHGKTWGMLKRVSQTGVPPAYHEIQLREPGRVPAVCKVDFMEDPSGRLWIAEIDGHNKHGLGYSTLAARTRRLSQNGHASFPGAAVKVAEAIRAKGTNQAILLYADQERFYRPEFLILQDELKGLGIDLQLMSELDAVCTGDTSHLLDALSLAPLLDFPFMYKNQALNQVLCEGYECGRLDFLFPPKPFLGSKAVMAILRNDEADPQLEAMLHAFISSEALQCIRAFIPPTYLVDKSKRPEYWQALCADGNFVLKESISSGMKGTIFSSDARFSAALAKAVKARGRAVLQREVQNRARRFEYFTDTGACQSAEWFTRVTVHFAGREVADIVVTARQDRSVHGATDCLQLGAVITS